MIKRSILLISVIAIYATSGCVRDHSKPLLITISASAYIGASTSKVYANFAVLNATQTDVIKNENTLDEYFKGHPGYTNYLLDYRVAGDYVIAVQLPTNSQREKLYSYRNITVSADHPSTDNNMVFTINTVSNYQVWTNR